MHGQVTSAVCLALLLAWNILMPGWPERALGFDIVLKYPLVPVGFRCHAFPSDRPGVTPSSHASETPNRGQSAFCTNATLVP